MNLKIGDKVRVSYSGETGVLAHITHINVYSNKISYEVSTARGSSFEVTAENIYKVYGNSLMTIKSYRMVIIPFEYVPHRVIFRWKLNWWKRIVGTDQQAECFIDAQEITNAKLSNSELIDPKELVIINKADLEKTIAQAFIVDEFNLLIKNDRDK